MAGGGKKRARASTPPLFPTRVTRSSPHAYKQLDGEAAEEDIEVSIDADARSYGSSDGTACVPELQPETEHGLPVEGSRCSLAAPSRPQGPAAGSEAEDHGADRGEEEFAGFQAGDSSEAELEEGICVDACDPDRDSQQLRQEAMAEIDKLEMTWMENLRRAEASFKGHLNQLRESVDSFVASHEHAVASKMDEAADNKQRCESAAAQLQEFVRLHGSSVF